MRAIFVFSHKGFVTQLQYPENWAEFLAVEFPENIYFYADLTTDNI